MLFRNIAFAFILSLALASCNSSSSPNNTNTSTPSSIPMQLLSDLPRAGGDVSSVAFLDATTLVAVIDGKIATLPISGGDPTILHSNAVYTTVRVGAAKEVYALTNSELWVLDDVTSTPKKSTVFSRTGQTLNVYLSIGLNGQPYLRILSYPSSMQVWTSSNKGASWDKVKVPTESEYGGGLAFGPSNEMYLSSPVSFYASKDAGVTWTKYPAVVANYGGEIVVRKNGDILYYIPNGGGLWSSSDKGANFKNLTPFNANPFYSTIIESADGVLFALLKPSSSPVVEKAARLMKSTDGVTWTHVLFAEGRDLALQASSIAVAMSSNTSGGVATSTDKGLSFISHGLQAVQSITSIGWNTDGALTILADKNLFAKTSTGWQSYGNALVFGGLTSTGDGLLYVAGLRNSYLSADAGRSWKEIAMPPSIGVSGTGEFRLPVVFGLKQSDALVSTTYYRYDLFKHTNGVLIRLSPNGTATTMSNGTNYTWMAQNGTGLLYARTENFTANKESSDNGATWKEVTTVAPGFAFNNTNKFIAYGTNLSFSWGTLGSIKKDSLSLNGFTSQSNYILSARFDAQNRLHVLTSDKGLFVSTQAWN